MKFSQASIKIKALLVFSGGMQYTTNYTTQLLISCRWIKITFVINRNVKAIFFLLIHNSTYLDDDLK